MKRKITFFVMLAALVTLIPIGNVQAKSKSPAKLTTKDFISTGKGGKKVDFFKNSKTASAYWYCIFTDTDVKDKDQVIYSTNRGVKPKSTEAYVKKQYGNTTKRKVDQKERYYKCMKYESVLADLSLWKNYLEYNYNNKGNNYKIRFYLDAKNKVSAIAYIKNLNRFYNYPNKEINAGLIFKAPRGKAVSTKKINGKKVYMLPKGTKIRFNKPIRTLIWLQMYDPYGECIAGAPGYGIGYGLKHGKDYDLENQLNKKLMDLKNPSKNVNIRKMGKYLYFCLRVQGSNTTAPAHYYFRFK